MSVTDTRLVNQIGLGVTTSTPSVVLFAQYGLIKNTLIALAVNLNLNPSHLIHIRRSDWE